MGDLISFMLNRASIFTVLQNISLPKLSQLSSKSFVIFSKPTKPFSKIYWFWNHVKFCTEGLCCKNEYTIYLRAPGWRKRQHFCICWLSLLNYGQETRVLWILGHILTLSKGSCYLLTIMTVSTLAHTNLTAAISDQLFSRQVCLHASF